MSEKSSNKEAGDVFAHQDKIQELEAKLEETFTVKNAFTLLSLYQKYCLFEKSNNIRRFLVKHVCFTEKQWKDWISEELAEAGDVPEKKKLVLKVFELSFEDGYHPGVAEMYLSLMRELYEEKMLTKNNTKTMMEKTIAIFCQDFAFGPSIFRRCRSFENKVIQTLQSTPTVTPAIQRQINDSVAYVRQLYLRELKLALSDTEKIWSDYLKWEKEEDKKSKVEEVYLSTKASSFPAAQELEEEFKSAAEWKQDFFARLMDALADKGNNPSGGVIQSSKLINFFEKAIASSVDIARNKELWQTYISFLEKNNTPTDQLRKVFARATKVCPIDLDIHTKYLLSMEKCHEQASDIEEQLLRLINMKKYQLDEQYILYSGYLSFTVRNIRVFENTYDDSSKSSKDKFNPANVKIMREAFQKSVHYFEELKDKKLSLDLEQQQEEDDAIQSLQIYAYELNMKWADVETFILQDRNQMVMIMEKVMKKRGEHLGTWKRYYEYERVFNNTQPMRAIIKRAFEYVKDDRCGAALMQVEFEQDYGTVNMLEQAIKKQIEVFEETSRINAEALEIEQESNETLVEDEQVPIQSEDEPTSVATTTIEAIEMEQQSLNSKRKHHGSGASPQKVEKSPSKKQKVDENNSVEQPKTQKDPPSSYHVQDGSIPTCFVKNLPSTITEEQISEIFPNGDHIRAVRIAKHRGVAKGFAYIDFDSLAEAKAACQAVNNVEFEGKKLFVALSDPPKKQTSVGSCTAFLNNLSYQITDQIIKDAFPGSEINQVRIIRDQDNNCKGFAYVEFVSEEVMVFAMEAFKMHPYIQNRRVICMKADAQKERKKDDEKDSEQSSVEKKNNNKSHKFTVFLKNLGYKVRESDLIEFFENKGIDQIIIAKDDHGAPKGFGFITFKDFASYEAALGKKQGTLKGKEFEIQKYDKGVPMRDQEKQEIHAKENKSNDDFRKLFN